jgi:hypothetical protein
LQTRHSSPPSHLFTLRLVVDSFSLLLPSHFLNLPSSLRALSLVFLALRRFTSELDILLALCKLNG